MKLRETGQQGDPELEEQRWKRWYVANRLRDNIQADARTLDSAGLRRRQPHKYEAPRIHKPFNRTIAALLRF